ncbi:MAG: hypothetical protein NTZ16_06365 [Verrucomicrobia bacterium]|nr:hypothetical protein [Verrucomicrobiota bacterium]
MKLPPTYFNIILLLLALAGGCQTDDKKKELTVLRLHIEANAAAGDGKSPRQTPPAATANPCPSTAPPRCM